MLNMKASMRSKGGLPMKRGKHDAMNNRMGKSTLKKIRLGTGSEGTMF